MSSNPPDPATDEVAFSTRTPGPSRRRVGLITGAAVALVAGAVATSMAASPAPSTSGITNGGVPAPFLADPSLDEDFLELDHGRFAGHRFREITITAISGQEVTLGTDDGWTRTIAVTDAVELTKGGQDIELPELAVGDQVRFRQTRNDDGTYTVTALAVVVPSARGEVSDVSASGFKLTTRDGSVWTIAVDSNTEYLYGAGDGSLADVTNGTTAIVKGTSTGDNALTALTVRVRPDRAIGKVTAKTSDSITITKRDGSPVTVHVDGDTIYRVAGVENADLGDVAVDMGIGVTGRERADGSIDADTVAAGSGRGLRWGREGGDRGGFDGPRADPGGLEVPGVDEDLSAG
jgi:hypothetical protein